MEQEDHSDNALPSSNARALRAFTWSALLVVAAAFWAAIGWFVLSSLRP